MAEKDVQLIDPPQKIVPKGAKGSPQFVLCKLRGMMQSGGAWTMRFMCNATAGLFGVTTLTAKDHKCNPAQEVPQV